MQKPYKEQIIDAVNELIKAREIIFSQIVSLAMSNELVDIEATFNQGDTYSFSLEQFENVKDVNVQAIVQLCKTLESEVFRLMDLNGITDNEVDL